MAIAEVFDQKAVMQRQHAQRKPSFETENGGKRNPAFFIKLLFVFSICSIALAQTKDFKIVYGSSKGTHPGGGDINPETIGGLQGYQNAVIFLKGFSFDYLDEDHHINEIGLRFRDVSFNQEYGFLTWNAEFVYGDGGDYGLDDDFDWSYDYMVVAFHEGFSYYGQVSGITKGEAEDWYPMSVPAEQTITVLSGFRCDFLGEAPDFGTFDPKDHHINDFRVGITNQEPSDYVLSNTCQCFYEDKNYDDEYYYQIEPVSFYSPKISVVTRPSSLQNQRYECAGGKDNKHYTVSIPQGYDYAAVMLSGWDFDFMHKDHHINIIDVSIVNQVFNPETRELSWNVAVDYEDKNGDDDYFWSFWYTVVAFSSAEVLNTPVPQPYLDLPIKLTLGDGGKTITSNISIFGGLDFDKDGLNDYWEDEALRQINPYIELDEEENWIFHRHEHPVVNFVHVYPYPTKDNPQYVIFSYLQTWARDYGWKIFKMWAHNGDIERVDMAWHVDVDDDKKLSLYNIYHSAHGEGDLFSHSKITYPYDLDFLNKRIRLYSSEDKHALYYSCDDCESAPEDCGEGGTFRFPCYNIGEYHPEYPEHPELDEGRFQYLRINTDLGVYGFPEEPFEGSCEADGEKRFCGGLGSCGDACDEQSPSSLASNMKIPNRLRKSLLFARMGKADVVEVLDCSGSMNELTNYPTPEDFWGTKIGMMKNAANLFVVMMGMYESNKLGVVKFNWDAVSVMGMKELTSSNINEFTQAISSLEARGGCSIGDGLNLAYQQIRQQNQTISKRDKAIFLITDGGETDEMSIDDMVDVLAEAKIPVHTILLGYGTQSEIDEAKLATLTDATKGSFRVANRKLDALKYVQDMFGKLSDGGLILDPTNLIGRGEDLTIPFVVTWDQSNVDFVVSWEQYDDAIDVVLISPSGITIPPKYVYNSPMCVYYGLTFPLPDVIGEGWMGEWQIKLTGSSSIPADKRIEYWTSVIADGDVDLEVKIDTSFHYTGDDVRVTAELKNGDDPLPGAKIKVYCDVPKISSGNVLHNGKVPLEELMNDSLARYGTNGDRVTMIERKLQILNQQAGKMVLERGKTDMELYDDGKHDDGEENDGVYSNVFKKTTTSGTYSMRFVASGIPAGAGLTTTREWTKSFYNKVRVEHRPSVTRVERIESTNDGVLYDVELIPKDKYNNFLGPGYEAEVIVSTDNNQYTYSLTDNVDGSYTRRICIPHNVLAAGAELKFKIDGQVFPAVKPPVIPKCFTHLQGGVALPFDSLANDYKKGFCIVGIVDYPLSSLLDFPLASLFSLRGIIGYDFFPPIIPGLIGVDDKSILNLSINGKISLPEIRGFSGFLEAGPGFYFAPPTLKNAGFNGGIGINWSPAPRILAELGVDYHSVFDQNTRFLQIHIGVGVGI